MSHPHAHTYMNNLCKYALCSSTQINTFEWTERWVDRQTDLQVKNTEKWPEENRQTESDREESDKRRDRDMNGDRDRE